MVFSYFAPRVPVEHDHMIVGELFLNQALSALWTCTPPGPQHHGCTAGSFSTLTAHHRVHRGSTACKEEAHDSVLEQEADVFSKWLLCLSVITPCPIHCHQSSDHSVRTGCR